jgi:hypothetical protein
MSDENTQGSGPTAEPQTTSSPETSAEPVAAPQPMVEMPAAAQPMVEMPAAAPPMPGAPATTAAGTSQSNGFAVAALVLGIVSLVLFFTIWLPFLLGTLAIVFGALGIGKAGKLGGRQKGLAIAGLVCGAVGIVAAILFIVLIVNTVNDPSFQDVINSLVQSASP